MTHLSYVLLVDYDKTANFLNQRIIRRVTMASQVEVAITGQQALEVVATLAPPAPELLFVSLHLEHGSDMSGPQFIAEFHRRYPGRQTIVALLALNVSPQQLEQLQATHQGPIFHKPLTDQDIKGLMQQYFPQARVAAH